MAMLNAPPPTNPNLMACPDCKELVSRSAEKCPHCGRTLKQRTTAVGALAAVILGLVGGYFLLHLLGYL